MDMKEVTKVYLNDPGHGWLSVKKKELVDLGIETKISNWSYMKGKSVYLEEDCDAGVYIEAQKERGVIIKVKCGVQSKLSPVRSYEYYNC
jgi:hypothetical protein